MDIYQYDISDILNKLPNIERFSDDHTIDLLVCTLGFEDRTHIIIDELLKKDKLNRTILLLIKYPTNINDNLLNAPFFEKAVKKMAGYYEITYSRNDFTKLLSDKLNLIIKASIHRVVFDISTCSSYVFFPTIKTLMNYDINLTIAYSEAETYYPTNGEWKEIEKKAHLEQPSLFVESFEKAEFLTLGVEDVYPCPLFSEMNSGNMTSLLIAVPNFNILRMQAIIERDREINKTPNENIYWLIGDPPSVRNKWRSEAIKISNNLFTNITYVSTLEYKEMLKTFETIWLNNRYKYYMTIGSLGSKMQHLGTFFFICLHPDVGLWMAEPKQFRAKQFSSGCGFIWQIRFGETKELRDFLAIYHTFKWKL